MSFPFKETQLKENVFLREFVADFQRDAVEEWHRDHEDRIVEVIENIDWLLQMDNELPQLLEGNRFIPKEVYHRVIMGKGKLVVKLTKLT